jgi:NAD+ synthase (glutamine-hydrolysing)
LPNPSHVHVAAVALDQTVGDWSGNAGRVIAAIGEARRRGARVLLTPELSLSGYSLGDRVLRRGTLEHSWAALVSILPHTTGMIVFVGLPLRHRGVLYNGVAMIADGRVAGICCKENLATGDVEYENRWYAGWPRGQVDTFEAPDGTEVPIGSLVFEADGIGRFAIEVCEDAWKGIRPGSIYALSGAHLMFNASATWFVLGKQAMRRRMIRQISDEDSAVYVFASLLGCDDTRLIFDGALLIAQSGDVLVEGRRFRFHGDFEMIDHVVDLDAVARRRLAMGSWRQQVESLHRGELGPLPEIVPIAGDYTSGVPAPAPMPFWLRGLSAAVAEPSLEWLVHEGLFPRAIGELDIPHLELELALCLAMRDYTKKTRIKGVCLALSGGRDSTMCALIVHRMMRYDRPELDAAALKAEVNKRFVTVWMETENSSTHTRDAAAAVADELGAKHIATSIQQAFDLNVALAEKMTGIDLDWKHTAHDIPLQNVQARIRGTLVWFVANLHDFVLLTTSNLSECAVGYCTMDGDTAGGLAPIANVPKSLVSLWLDWAARTYDYKAVQRVFDVPPTAELRPPDRNQTDEDDLMPFLVLDQLMFLFVQRGQDPLEMFQTLWPSLKAHYQGDPRGLAAHIHKFTKKMCQAQWKRERFAISFRVTAFDLDPKTGFRFPPVQAPFTEELAELDRYVASL